MSRRLEELAHAETRMGLLTLRRRHDKGLGQEVFEVKLDDEFLMSSAWTVAERRLAALGLSRHDGARLRVVVGGLGLGYTAVTALEDARVATLHVVDALAPVIDWHRRALLPEAAALVEDARCTLVEADFFAWARGTEELPIDGDVGVGVGDDAAYDVVLLDVDHSTEHLLDPSHADLYTPDGIARMRRRMTADGVFAMWSDDPPHEHFLTALRASFASVDAEVVTFPNALTRGESTATVYVAR